MGTAKDRVAGHEPTKWVNNETALNATNMNRIEDAISGVIETLKDYEGEGNGSQALNSKIVDSTIVKNIASGESSTAAGIGTEATHESEFVVGKYNANAENALFIVGNGENTNKRSNALEVTEGHTNVNNGLTIKSSLQDDVALSVDGETEMKGEITISGDGDETTIINNKSVTTPYVSTESLNTKDIESENVDIKGGSLSLINESGTTTKLNSDGTSEFGGDSTFNGVSTFGQDATFKGNVTIDGGNTVTINSPVGLSQPITINCNGEQTEQTIVDEDGVKTTKLTSDTIVVGDDTTKLSLTNVNGTNTLELLGNVIVPTISDSSSDNAPVDKKSFDGVKDVVDQFFLNAAEDEGLNNVVDTLKEVQDTLNNYNSEHSRLDNTKANKIDSDEDIIIETDAENRHLIKTTLDANDRKISVMFDVEDVPKDFIYSDVRVDVTLDDVSYGGNDIIDENSIYPYVFPDCINKDKTDLLNNWKKGAEVIITMPSYVVTNEDDNDTYGTYSAEFVGRDLIDVYNELESSKANKFKLDGVEKDLFDVYDDLQTGKANLYKYTDTTSGEPRTKDLSDAFGEIASLGESVVSAETNASAAASTVITFSEELDKKASKIGSNAKIVIDDDKKSMSTTIDYSDRSIIVRFDKESGDEGEGDGTVDVDISVALEDGTLTTLENKTLTLDNDEYVVFPSCVDDEVIDFNSLWKANSTLTVSLVEGSAYKINSVEFVGRDLPEVYDELSGKLSGVKEQPITKGYRITGTSSTTGSSTNVNIFNLNSEVSHDWVAGNRISFDIGGTYTYGYKISKIDGARIRITPALPPDTEITIDNESCIWNLDKPQSGDIDIGIGAFAQGIDIVAIGKGSVALNRQTKAEGNFSFAANRGTIAGYGAAAFGKGTEALGTHSFTSGWGTIASSDYQRAEGKFNARDTENKYAHIVGNGTGVTDTKRKNIYTLDWDGNGWFVGNVYIGEDKKELATKEYVDSISPSVNLGTLTITYDGEILGTYNGNEVEIIIPGQSSIDIDSTLSIDSTNSVQNKVITTKFNEIDDSISSVDKLLSMTLEDIDDICGSSIVAATSSEVTF